MESVTGVMDDEMADGSDCADTDFGKVLSRVLPCFVVPVAAVCIEDSADCYC